MRSSIGSTQVSLLISLLAISSFAQLQANQCGHQVLKATEPAGFRCGAPFAAAAGYARRTTLNTYPNVEEQDCFDHITDANAMAVTYSTSGLCTTFKRGAGPAKHLKASQDTKFYNKACFTELDCFTLEAFSQDTIGKRKRVEPVTEYFSAVPGSDEPHKAALVNDDAGDNGIAEGQFYLYTAPGTTSSLLVADIFGAALYQVNSGDVDTDYLIFPEDPSAGSIDVLSVTCSFTTTNDLVCQSQDGNIFSQCTSTANLVLGAATGVTCATVPDCTPFTLTRTPMT